MSAFTTHTWRSPHFHLMAALAMLLVAASACSDTEDSLLASIPLENGAGGSQCDGISTRAIADDLMANAYLLTPHPLVELPGDPTWAEDPVGDPNWEFQFHSLRYLVALINAWRDTGDQQYLDRVEFMLKDWLSDNPRANPPSEYSWDDHSTAQRAKMLACAAEEIDTPWISRALRLHGETLADKAFYVEEGNHAFNQAQGLLAVGCALENIRWIDLALTRMADVITKSIGPQGVTNEQAVGYQLYNYVIYREAIGRLAACGVATPSEFDRVELMPEFLAHATLPNGNYVMLGDTGARRARKIEGTIAEYAAARGKRGPQPETNVAIYDAGFVFARTGWGEKSPIEDAVFFSARFGPSRMFHGHVDGGSLTMYGYGSPLVVDAGKFTYAKNKWRDYFLSASAHNVVLVAGMTPDEGAETDLIASTITDDFVFIFLEREAAPGVEWQRRVLFSMNGYIVVDDRLANTQGRSVYQLWHLVHDANPVVTGTTTTTRRTSGNLAILQLGTVDSVTVVTAAETPIQGWLSYDYLELLPSPTVIATASAQQPHFLTVLHASTDRFVPQVATVEFGTDRIQLIVTGNGFSETVLIDGNVGTVSPNRG